MSANTSALPLAKRIGLCAACDKPATAHGCDRCGRFAYCSNACKEAQPDAHRETCYRMVHIFKNLTLPLMGECMNAWSPAEFVRMDSADPKTKKNEDTIHVKQHLADPRPFTTAMEYVTSWPNERTMQRYLFAGKAGALTAAVLHELENAEFPQFIFVDEPAHVAYDERYVPFYAIKSRPEGELGGGRLTVVLGEGSSEVKKADPRPRPMPKKGKKSKNPGFESPRFGEEEPADGEQRFSISSNDIPIILLVPASKGELDRLECVAIDLVPFMFCPTNNHIETGTLEELGVESLCPLRKLLEIWKSDLNTMSLFDQFSNVIKRQKIF